MLPRRWSSETRARDRPSRRAAPRSAQRARARSRAAPCFARCRASRPGWASRSCAHPPGATRAPDQEYPGNRRARADVRCADPIPAPRRVLAALRCSSSLSPAHLRGHRARARQRAGRRRAAHPRCRSIAAAKYRARICRRHRGCGLRVRQVSVEGNRQTRRTWPLVTTPSRREIRRPLTTGAAGVLCRRASENGDA